MANLSRAERETISRFSEEPDEPVTFETFNKRHALRLIKAGAEVVRTSTRGESVYWTLRFPKEWWRWPRKPSEARREAARKRYHAEMARVQSGSGHGTPGGSDDPA